MSVHGKHMGATLFAIASMASALVALPVAASAPGPGRAGAASTSPDAGAASTSSDAGAASTSPDVGATSNGYEANLVELARNNTDYRRVLFTGNRTQIALMSIPSGEDIGREVHPNVEQILFVVSGQGRVLLNGEPSLIGPGYVLVVSPGVEHDVTNVGSDPLQLYTIYVPPNHIAGRVHRTKADAQADTADEAYGNRAK